MTSYTAIRPTLGGTPTILASEAKRTSMELNEALRATGARFMLSTWHSNRRRINGRLPELWGDFNILAREHFYHVGAREINRKPMIEALVANYETSGNVGLLGENGIGYPQD